MGCRDGDKGARQTLLIGSAIEGDVDGAAPADGGPRVLVELVGGIAHADGTRPGGAVVIGVGEVDRRTAGAIELGPGHEGSTEVMASAAAGVHRDRFVVWEFAVAAFLGAVAGPGGDGHGR